MRDIVPTVSLRRLRRRSRNTLFTTSTRPSCDLAPWTFLSHFHRYLRISRFRLQKSVIMPALEMAQETGTLLRWLKREGDAVSAGEPLLEIETDKATAEIEA